MKPIPFLLALICVLIACIVGGVAQAGPVVRIQQKKCEGGTCRQIWQTGTVIGRHTDDRVIVLTCKHGCETESQLLVELDGKFVEAEWFGRDKDSDLALILVEYATGVEWFTVAEDDPKSGDSLTVGGWALHKTLAYRKTKINESTDVDIVVDGTFSQGESGGPAFNAQNKLVGVIVGNSAATDDKGNAPPAATADGYLTCCRCIRRFVNAQCGCIPSNPPNRTRTKVVTRSPVVPPPVDDVPPAPVPAPIDAPAPQPIAGAQGPKGATGQRGEKGDDGAQGPIGPPGGTGLKGESGKDADPKVIADLTKRVAALEAAMALLQGGITVQMFDQNGKLVDENTYDPKNFGGKLYIQLQVDPTVNPVTKVPKTK